MNYESTLIRSIDRQSNTAEDRSELLQSKLIPRARNYWKSLIRQRRLSPNLVSADRLYGANVSELVKELQEINR